VNSVRLIFAGLFCFVVLLFAAGPVIKYFPKDSPVLMGLTLGLVLIGTAILALFFFNLGRRKFPPGPTLEELEAQGLVVSQDFQAIRAFEVEEFEDEGQHYFIELADGSVLFLTGQYFYDITMMNGDTEDAKSGAFPTTEFTIKRHKVEGHVVDVICRGRLLKPEVVAKPFGPEILERDGIPEDGAIIRDKTYDAIKAQHTARG
jgi:hypothetical protein